MTPAALEAIRERLAARVERRENNASSLSRFSSVRARDDDTAALLSYIDALREALADCVDALARCYDVDSYPANGQTTQDAALTKARRALGDHP
jgi:hypothetical protein